MSDFFHEQIPDSYVTHACIVMELANWHTYQVLTKRAKRMRELLRTDLSAFGDLAHIWWGVTVENRQHGLPRIEALRQTPAAVRFLSIEPLLEDLGALNLTGIHWVIVGGESGPRCRPMKPEWVRNIRDQCETASVPFFFKQWGGFPKRKYGRELDGATYNAMPAAKHTQAAGSSLRRVMIEEVNGWYPTQTEWIPLAMPLRAEAPSP
jgi:protein gp37